MVAGRSPAIQARLPELDPVLTFTAVTIPNPHLVAVVDKYVESDLVAMGEQVAARRETFPAGANLSVLLPLAPEEIFVRTFERGAGLTASCGSGMAAARAVYSRIGHADPERDVLIRNAGGVATVSLQVRDGQWFPVLEGNATFVYRAEVDPSALTQPGPARQRRPAVRPARTRSALTPPWTSRTPPACAPPASTPDARSPGEHGPGLARPRSAAARRSRPVTSAAGHFGCRTVRAPGPTVTVRVRPGATISPSIWRGRPAAAVISIRRAWNRSSVWS